MPLYDWRSIRHRVIMTVYFLSTLYFTIRRLAFHNSKHVHQIRPKQCHRGGFVHHMSVQCDLVPGWPIPTRPELSCPQYATTSWKLPNPYGWNPSAWTLWLSTFQRKHITIGLKSMAATWTRVDVSCADLQPLYVFCYMELSKPLTTKVDNCKWLRITVLYQALSLRERPVESAGPI